MKIAHIAASRVPSRTANSLQAIKMCQAFKQRGAEVIFIVRECSNCVGIDEILNFYGVEQRFEIRQALVKPGIGRLTRFSYQAVKIAQAKKADLIFTINFQAAWWAGYFKIPFILELHLPPMTLTERLCLKLIINSQYLKYFVAITDAVKRWYVRHGICENKIIVLPDAIDLERFPQGHFYEPKPQAEIKIGYAGHLYKGRGIDLILRLAQKMKNICFLIMGGEDEHIEFWKNYAKKDNITNVKFLGFIPYSELPKYLNEVDILLMPHQKRVAAAGNRGNIAEFTSPMKMFEYMATGKPIIASDLPVLREVLKDKVNSMLVESDLLDKWIETIEFLINNPQMARKIGENARREVEENYTWIKRAEQILQMI